MQALLLRLFFIRESKNNRAQNRVRQTRKRSGLSDKTRTDRWSQGREPGGRSLEKLARLFFWQTRAVAGDMCRKRGSGVVPIRDGVFFFHRLRSSEAHGSARPRPAPGVRLSFKKIQRFARQGRLRGSARQKPSTSGITESDGWAAMRSGDLQRPWERFCAVPAVRGWWHAGRPPGRGWQPCRGHGPARPGPSLESSMA